MRLLTCILVLLFLALTTNGQEKEQSKKSLVGKVEAVRPGSIDVQTLDKTTHTLKVTDQAKIMVDGKNVKVEQVPVNRRVTVDYVENGKEQVVKEIKTTQNKRIYREVPPPRRIDWLHKRF